MSKTPDIPDWIKSKKFPGYTNVYSFLPDATALYGTETLFGDWDAPTLLLAKDAAPTHVIKETGWRHADRNLGDVGGWRTNQRLKSLADDISGSKLYGSATAHMLYDDPNWSRSLQGFWEGELHDHLVEVLRWTICSMPNIQNVACLGREAWYLTSMAMSDAIAAKQWSHYREGRLTLNGSIKGKLIRAIPLFHPGARISTSRMKTNWDILNKYAQGSA